MSKLRSQIHISKLLRFALVAVVLIFAICALRLGTVYAQQIALSISPPLVELAIKPGKSVLVAYTIENSGDPSILSTKVLPFEPQGNLGHIKLKDEFEGPVQFSLDNSGIQLGESFFLKTKEKEQVLLRIRVPEGAREGDYYYSFLAETEPPPVSEGIASPRAKATIGSNILITVTNTGKIDVKAKISVFDVITKNALSFFGKKLRIFDSNDKIPVVLQVSNSGPNSIKPEGEIVLKGNFGEKATFTVLPQNILSESQRLLTATPSASIDCDEEVNERYCTPPPTLILSGFFVGNYTLSTSVNFGEGTPNLYASTSFFALPLKFIAVLLASLFIAFLIIFKIRNSSD